MSVRKRARTRTNSAGPGGDEFANSSGAPIVDGADINANAAAFPDSDYPPIIPMIPDPEPTRGSKNRKKNKQQQQQQQQLAAVATAAGTMSTPFVTASGTGTADSDQSVHETVAVVTNPTNVGSSAISVPSLSDSNPAPTSPGVLHPPPPTSPPAPPQSHSPSSLPSTSFPSSSLLRPLDDPDRSIESHDPTSSSSSSSSISAAPVTLTEPYKESEEEQTMSMSMSMSTSMSDSHHHDLHRSNPSALIEDDDSALLDFSSSSSSSVPLSASASSSRSLSSSSSSVDVDKLRKKVSLLSERVSNLQGELQVTAACAANWETKWKEEKNMNMRLWDRIVLLQKQIRHMSRPLTTALASQGRL